MSSANRTPFVVRWLRRAMGVAILASVAAAVWFFWPVLVANRQQRTPERGVTSLAEPLKPGCSVNAELRLELSGEGRTTPAGKPAAASVIAARDGCTDLDRPLVAFNWWTLRGWISSLLMARYQLYAVQQVANKARVTSVVFRGSGPRVVLVPPGRGPDYGTPWGLPWVHQGVTMPFYPSAKAILHMVDASRDRYFEEIQIKHDAMGEDGYFGFQACLANCEALLQPDRQGLWEFLRPEIRPPVLALHARSERTEADAFLHALARSAGMTIAYAGWTVADVLVEAEDGTREPFLQKPLWQDLTVLIAPDAGVSIEQAQSALLTDAAFLRLRAQADALVVLAY